MVKLKNHRRKKIKKRSHKFNLNLDYLIKNEIKHNAIRQEFSEDCLKLANSVSKKKILDHEDLTHIPFVTIDGKDSKDFDDAVWSKKKKNKIEIMIAIIKEATKALMKMPFLTILPWFTTVQVMLLTLVSLAMMALIQTIDTEHESWKWIRSGAENAATGLVCTNSTNATSGTFSLFIDVTSFYCNNTKTTNR